MLGKVVVVGALLALFAVHPAAAQPDCFQTFGVKKKPVAIDWLGGAGTGKVMQCEAAEKLRGAIYTKNKAFFDQLAAGTPVAYVSGATTTVADLEKRIAEFDKKVQNNDTLSALQVAAEVVLYEINKAAAIVSCIAPEATVTKFFCAAALLSTANDTYKIAAGNITKNDFADIAARARKDLETAKAQLDIVKAKLKSQDMPSVNKSLSNMFFGYCQAIKRDCL